MKAKSFKIEKKQYPSTGKVYYRVRGTINGNRISKNCNSREEAEGVKLQLELKRENQRSDLKTIATRLTQEETFEAERAFKEKGDIPEDLSFIVKFFKKNYVRDDEVIQLKKAVNEYLDLKSKDEERGLISNGYYRGVHNDINHFEQSIRSVHLSAITENQINKYLEDRGLGPKAWNNVKSTINNFFKFCLKNRYIKTNPVEHLRTYTQREIQKTAKGEAPILKPEEFEELLEYLQTYQDQKGVFRYRNLIPYYAVCGFAGVRPDYNKGEMKKIKWKDIQFDRNNIKILPSTSKVITARDIDLQPNLKMWLNKYPLKTDSFIIKNFKNLRQEISDKFQLEKDVLRHSYISYHIAMWRSMGDTALQAGNSEAKIKTNYLNVVSREDAEKYWNILPLKG